MLIANKPLSIGEHVLDRGDHVTAEMQRILPPGRVESLKALRMVEEVTDELAADRRLDAIEARLVALEERLASHKHAGRPPKMED